MPDHWYHSWQHSRSKPYHLLKYVITRIEDFAKVRSTHAMRGADCSTDHYLIRSLLNLHIKLSRKKIFHTMARLIISGKLFMGKCTIHLLTLWDTQLGNTRLVW